MKVSVLLPVYNGELYLRKSIDSVLNQTYDNLELLIGFNGTVDGSRDIVAGYNDPRIRLFDYGDDKGKPKTMNKLLSESNGEVIALQDDDDVWLPEKLEKQIKFINDYDVVGSQISYINEEDNIIGGVDLALEHSSIKEKSFKGDNQIANSAAIIKKTSLQAVNGWREELEALEDFDLWLRMLKNNSKFKNLSSIEVKHRLHSRSNFNTKQHDLSTILDLKALEKKPSFWKKLKRVFIKK